MVFSGFAPVNVQVHVGLFFFWGVQASGEAESSIAGVFLAVEDDLSFPGYFGESEKDDQIVFFGLGQSFQHFGSTGGKL